MQPPWCPSAIVLDIKISWLNLLGTQIGLAWGLGEYMDSIEDNVKEGVVLDLRKQGSLLVGRVRKKFL